MSAHEVLSVDSIGGRIKKLRTKADLSLSELARISGVSKSYLWNLENRSQHQQPSAETVYALAQALNTTMSQLLGKRLLTEPQVEPDPVLLKFAKAEGLDEAEIMTLASIKWRGDPPQTAERWKFVHDALRASRSFDK